MNATKINSSQICAAIVCLMLSQALFAQSNRNKKNEYLKTKEQDSSTKIGIVQILFSGVVHFSPDKNQVWYVPNIFELFPLNTVEGIVINPQVTFTQNLENERFFSLNPNIRYGFGNNRIQAQLKTKYFYSPKRKGLLTISGGRTIAQLYNETTLSALNNILYTSAFNENFLKVYERTYIELDHSFAPIKNLLFTTVISWNERNPLNNLSKYSGNRDFTSNNPKNIELNNTAFLQNTSVLLEAHLRWQIGHCYEKQRGKLISKGKYPALTIAYTNAVNEILGSDISYQKLAFQVTHDFKLLEGFGQVYLEVGSFISKDKLTFPDFNHFKGKQTIYGDYDANQFQLLEYYNYSTTSFYFQGHLEYHFKPLKKNEKSKLQPTTGINYLHTEAIENYLEFGIGLDKILKIWRIDFYNSWLKGKHNGFVIRVGVTLD